MVLAVERDVKPRNMNFAKVDRRRGVTNREGALIRINMIYRIHEMLLDVRITGHDFLQVVFIC